VKKLTTDKISTYLFYLALAFVVYMPLHVFIAQSFSLVTGGLDVWKAAKDVLLCLLVPVLLFLSYKRGLFRDKTFRAIIILGGLYTLLHGLFVLFDNNDDTLSAITASVYNTRLLGFVLLGYLVGYAKQGRLYLQKITWLVVLIATAVSVFGVLQYFLPNDFLTNFGYSIERGVKPLFFIDDKPDLPRVMSTLRDPNSLGAFLILPILVTSYALLKQRSKELFGRVVGQRVLMQLLFVQVLCLGLTFSRGALLGLGVSIITLLSIVMGKKLVSLLKKFWYVPVGFVTILFGLFVIFQDSYFIQNVVFHADESTVLEDPNELRVRLTQEAIQEIIDRPLGYGPGTAGLVAITNPLGGRLTENYYLQIAHEVGWLGLALFVAIIAIIVLQLFQLRHKEPLATLLLASLAGYLFYSLLIHLWSNEAVALQWWLLTGVLLGVTMATKQTRSGTIKTNKRVG
jgi:O-Antigen ligase